MFLYSAVTAVLRDSVPGCSCLCRALGRDRAILRVSDGCRLFFAAEGRCRQGQRRRGRARCRRVWQGRRSSAAGGWQGLMGNLEQLARLRSGVPAWNAWRNENPTLRPALSGADLRFSVLDRVDLHRANLSGADLTHAFCYQANLCGTELSAATMV